ncbi:MAG: hypothetical protein V7711_00750 [Pseudomonadales bacterium]
MCRYFVLFGILFSLASGPALTADASVDSADVPTKRCLSKFTLYDVEAEKAAKAEN